MPLPRGLSRRRGFQEVFLLVASGRFFYKVIVIHLGGGSWSISGGIAGCWSSASATVDILTCKATSVHVRVVAHRSPPEQQRARRDTWAVIRPHSRRVAPCASSERGAGALPSPPSNAPRSPSEGFSRCRLGVSLTLTSVTSTMYQKRYVQATLRCSFGPPPPVRPS